MRRLIPAAILVCLLAIPALSWAGVSLTIPGGLVISSVHSRCVSYARIAVRHNAANRHYRCRFRGGAGSSSLQHHYRWCRSVHGNPVRLRAVNRGRGRALARCRTTGGLRARCRSYARSAANYNQMNLRLRCGFRGPAWNSNPGYHYNWCLRNRVSAGRLAMENRRRAEAIRRCRARHGGLQRRCRQYARVSVRQNQENRRRRCGFSGPRWSFSLGFHYGWCYRHRVPAASLSRIIRRRARALARCGRPRPRARKGFTFPRWRGYYLDLCLGDNRGCGQNTANAFCRKMGFSRASAWRPWRMYKQTIELGTGRVCNKTATSSCDGFKFITCTK